MGEPSGARDGESLRDRLVELIGSSQALDEFLAEAIRSGWSEPSPLTDRDLEAVAEGRLPTMGPEKLATLLRSPAGVIYLNHSLSGARAASGGPPNSRLYRFALAAAALYAMVVLAFLLAGPRSGIQSADALAIVGPSMRSRALSLIDGERTLVVTPEAAPQAITDMQPAEVMLFGEIVDDGGTPSLVGGERRVPLGTMDLQGRSVVAHYRFSQWLSVRRDIEAHLGGGAVVHDSEGATALQDDSVFLDIQNGPVSFPIRIPLHEIAGEVIMSRSQLDPQSGSWSHPVLSRSTMAELLIEEAISTPYPMMKWVFTSTTGEGPVLEVELSSRGVEVQWERPEK